MTTEWSYRWRVHRVERRLFSSSRGSRECILRILDVFHVNFTTNVNVTTYPARRKHRLRPSQDRCSPRWSWIARQRWNFLSEDLSAPAFSAELRLAWVQSSPETRWCRKSTPYSRQMRRSSPTTGRWGHCEVDFIYIELDYILIIVVYPHKPSDDNNFFILCLRCHLEHWKLNSTCSHELRSSTKRKKVNNFQLNNKLSSTLLSLSRWFSFSQRRRCEV